MYSPPRYVSPPGYTQVRYTANPVAPSHNHTAPKYSYTATPNRDTYRKHTRSASQAPASYSYASPQASSYYPTASYSAGYYTATCTPPKQYEFVSPAEHVKNKAQRASAVDTSTPRHSTKPVPKTKSSSRSQYVRHDGVVVEEDEGYYSPGKGFTPPPPYNEYQHGYWVADHSAYDQVSGQKRSADPTPKYKPSSTSRPRATSHSSPKSAPPPSRPRAASKVKPAPLKATAADAAKARIPAGYSYKNWDPTEEPILLLGSVFDANSLGRWIYDWTIYHHGAGKPMSDLAAELWLLLIQIAGKIKRAEECLPRIRHVEDQDLVDDFLESGERLWDRFGKILKACEEYMWRVARKEAGKKGSSSAAVAMGAKSGCEFVDSIFGRDRKLEETEKLMTGMRLWSMRFDANCEDILRHPSG